jgi:nucleoside-diphosphate-sugar epimerase
MKIIVLGATGQIGSVIYDGLRKTHQVIGTSRKSSGKHIQFDPFHNDWSLLGKTDVLINCVGQIEPTKASSFHRIHVGLTQLIIKNREVIGHPKIVQISALGASAHHRVEFLRTKGVADDLLLKQPDTVIVRPSIVCTPRTMIVRKMLMMLPISRYTIGLVFIPKGFLKTRIQPVMPPDLADVVEAMCKAFDQRIINVVGPEAISFRDLIVLMLENKNQRLRLIEIPKLIMDVLVHCLVSFTIPKVINSQQYQLLFEDNIADAHSIQQILRRSLTPTKQFFINEFTYAAD